MKQITSKDELLEALRSECVVTWSFSDTERILSTDETMTNKVYNSVQDIYKHLYLQNFDSKLPDSFFVKIGSPEWNALTNDEDIINATITEDNFWLWREALRAWNGTYKIPDFLRVLQKRKLIQPGYNLHAVHVSTEDPTMVAYTPSLEYGKRDRQVRVKVGKYLHKYYSDVLSSEEIRDIANAAKPFELQWAETQEHMRHVYENGPGSCMSGKCWDHLRGHHPVDVYVGQFKLAYLERTKDYIVARGLVHIASKSYVRLYGDEADTLHAMLSNEGYEKANNWDGAKVRRIHLNNDRYVMPYIDGSARTILPIDDDPHHFVLTDEDNEDYDESAYCDSTGGYVDLASGARYSCDCCGGRFRDEDSLHYSEYRDTTIGDCCIASYRWAFVGPRGARDWVHEDDCTYCESDQEYYSDEYRDRAGLVETPSGDWYHLDDCVEDITGDYICADDAVDVGENEYGDTQYIHDREFDPHLIISLDPTNQGRIVAVYHPDYMPEDEVEAMEEQTYTTTDFGVRIGTEYESLGQLLLAYGPEHMFKNRRVFHFYWDLYTLQSMYKSMNKLPVAA